MFDYCLQSRNISYDAPSCFLVNLPHIFIHIYFFIMLRSVFKTYIKQPLLDFLGGSDGKESTCNAGGSPGHCRVGLY